MSPKNLPSPLTSYFQVVLSIHSLHPLDNILSSLATTSKVVPSQVQASSKCFC